MKSLPFGHYALSSCVAAALLAGCGGSQPPIGAPGTMPIQAERRASMRTAMSGDLLYVAYGREVAFVPLPQRRPVKKLSGLSGVRTGVLCSDGDGDVFVPQDASGQEEILEYAHGGTSPTNTLSSPVYGSSCSLDPTTGNLAETGYDGHSGNTIAIFSGASGTAQTYTDSSFTAFDYCTYDDKGDLFLDGVTVGSSSGLAEFDTKSGTFKTISLNKSIGMNDLAWDGKYVAINGGGRNAAEINRVAISGSVGTVVATVSLSDTEGLVGGVWSWLDDGTFIAPRGGTGKRDQKDINFWSYPRGGKPASVLLFGYGEIHGVTVSAPHQKR